MCLSSPSLPLSKSFSHSWLPFKNINWIMFPALYHLYLKPISGFPLLLEKTPKSLPHMTISATGWLHMPVLPPSFALLFNLAALLHSHRPSDCSLNKTCPRLLWGLCTFHFLCWNPLRLALSGWLTYILQISDHVSLPQESPSLTTNPKWSCPVPFYASLYLHHQTISCVDCVSVIYLSVRI